MFDIGFSELALIMVILLVVVGPERLPKLVRTAGLLMGKARTILRNVKADVQRELAAEELKQTLAKQAKSNPIHDIIEETQTIAKQAESTLKSDISEDIGKPTTETKRDSSS